MSILPLCDEQQYIFHENEKSTEILMKPSYSMRFSQSFSEEELTFAVEVCIKGADVFGARCIVKDNQPYIEFLPYQKREIPVFAFSTEEAFEIFCTKSNQENINNRDKLYYIFIYRIADSCNHLHFVINHLICDANSILLLTDKIQRVLLNPKQEITWYPFAAYLEKIRAYNKSEKYLIDKEFWEQRFLAYSKSDYLFTELIDMAEAPVRELSFTINKDLKKRLLDYCSSLHISLHLVIVTILTKYINTKMGKNRFYFDLTIGNRLGKNEKNSIGAYEVGHAYDVDFSSEPSLPQLYKTIHKQTKAYYRHRNFDCITQTYTKEYKEQYGEFMLQFGFSYICANRKPDISIATIEADTAKTDMLPLTLLISDYLNWEEMIFNYTYWEDYLDDVEIVEIHKDIVNNLLAIIGGEN